MISIIRDILASFGFPNWVNIMTNSGDLAGYFRSEYKKQAPAAYEYYRSTGNINYGA
jgi:hypothetical protein